MGPVIQESKRQDRSSITYGWNSMFAGMCDHFKKIMKKIKVASDKKETKPIDMHFNRKDLEAVFVEKNIIIRQKTKTQI